MFLETKVRSNFENISPSVYQIREKMAGDLTQRTKTYVNRPHFSNPPDIDNESRACVSREKRRSCKMSAH